MDQAQGKRVAITGAASGLGRALSFYYASQGWSVALADIHQQRGQETLEVLIKLGVPAFFMPVDVREEGSLLQWRDAIVERWGGLDVLINNAGVACHGSIEATPLDDWDWIVDINLLGVVRGCRVFASLFKKQNSGHIVNIASLAGLLHAPEMSSYNVTKAGVVALSDTLKSELHPFHIKVTVVCPAFFPTNLAETVRSPHPDIGHIMSKLFSQSKLSAEDVARIVFDQVKLGKFCIVPHRKFIVLWYIKRWAPNLYFKLMMKFSGNQKLEKTMRKVS